MIAVERRESAGRTYEEDDEEVLGTAFIPKEFNLNFECGSCPEVLTLFIGLDISSLAFVPTFSESCDLISVGYISCKDEIINKLLYNDASKLMFVTHERVVEDENASAWFRTITGIKPKFVVGQGLLSSSQYFGERESEYFLRKLESATSSSQWESMRGSLKKIRLLEPGNVVTGTAASLLSFCEARGIPSILLLSVSSASLSLGALIAFEQVWPFFQLLGDKDLRKPSNKEYSLSLKANTFLSTTENMYC